MNVRHSISSPAFAAMFILLVFPTVTRAQPDPDVIHVETWYHSGCTSPCSPTAYCEALYDSGENIVVQVNSCTRRINIWADDPDEHDIGQVLIERVSPGATLPSYIEILIGQGDFPYLMAQSAAAARDLNRIVFGNDNALMAITLFAGHITGDLTGSMTVGKLYRIDVDGVLYGGLGAISSPAAESLFNVYCGSTVFSLIAHSGTITHVEVAGVLGGSVSALDEGVVDVLAGTLRGSIGGGDFIGSVVVENAIETSLGGPVLIKTYQPDGTIDLIQAGSINANIEAGTLASRGSIGRAYATSGVFKGSVTGLDLLGVGGQAAIEAAGDMEAAIIVNGSVEPPIEIAGDLDADITVGESVNAPIEIGGALLSASTIKVYLSLGGDGSITIGDEDGLMGQVIINADGFDQGSWIGDVTVGEVTLAPTMYEVLPSSLGGGAVGFAGFNFHAWACSPPHEEVLGSPPSSVTVDHYGPVVNTTGNPPLKVEHRPAGSSGEWTDQTSQFSFTVESTFPYRRVTITPTSGNSFLDDKEYRIQPQYVSGGSGMTRLKSRYDGNTVGVVVYDYRFTIQPSSFGP